MSSWILVAEIVCSKVCVSLLQDEGLCIPNDESIGHSAGYLLWEGALCPSADLKRAANIRSKPVSISTAESYGSSDPPSKESYSFSKDLDKL
jgi:hypothetical protein